VCFLGPHDGQKRRKKNEVVTINVKSKPSLIFEALNETRSLPRDALTTCASKRDTQRGDFEV